MQKLLSTPLSLLAVAMTLGGFLLAQTQPTPPAKTSTAPAKAKTATPATKAHTATTAKTPAALTSKKDKFSYALGMNFGQGLGANLRKQSVEFDPAMVAQGMKDGLAGGKTRLTEDEAKAILTEVQNDVRKQQQEKTEMEGAANKKKGEDFLAANKTKEGVVTLPDGLQYKIITAGTGPKPAATDTVVCNYKGTFVDGTEFDNSYKRGEPITIGVTGVIKGWTEALQLMPVGSKWQLFIPSDLAYGPGGRGPGMPPNSTLVFEIELLKIQEKAPEAATPPTAPSATAQPKAPDASQPAAPDKNQAKPEDKPQK